MIRISGPRIYTENGVMDEADLIVQGKKIHAIEKNKKNMLDDVMRYPENYHLIPGFIDVHVHGANGFDVMDGSMEALAGISETLVREGTTAFLATTMTASIEKISEAVKTVGEYRQKQSEISGATILGVHLEGPFLSKEKVGAQNAKNILLPNINYLRDWQRQSEKAIRLVTLAPELQGAIELIQFLKSENIIASIGHTNSTYAETMAAIDAGCSHVTHLFNAMRSIHQREPGVITASLLSEKVSAELIVDNIHLHPAIVELVLKIKNPEKIILVTDAMRAKCFKNGSYDLGGQMVHVENNIASLVDGTLAGSVLKMISAVLNMMAIMKGELFDVIRFASENPARMLGIFDTKGSIQPGKDADLVVLNEKFEVVMTMVEGRVVYQNEDAVDL